MSVFPGRYGLAAALLLAAAAAWAGDRIVIADFSAPVSGTGLPAEWQVKEKSGKADFAVVQDNGVGALHLKSADTSYSIQREIDIDIARHPILAWTWKVTKLPAGGDFRRSRTDDQAAQLFIAFSKTRAIVYIWDTSAPQGLMEDAPSPPFMSIKAVVVRSGRADAGRWISETRNIHEDYRKLFGQEPPRAQGARLQINSQHTGTSAESFFGTVEFRKQ